MSAANSQIANGWGGYGVQSIGRYIKEPGQVGICPSRLFESREAALNANGPLKSHQVLVKVTVEAA